MILHLPVHDLASLPGIAHPLLPFFLRVVPQALHTHLPSLETTVCGVRPGLGVPAALTHVFCQVNMSFHSPSNFLQHASILLLLARMPEMTFCSLQIS